MISEARQGLLDIVSRVENWLHCRRLLRSSLMPVPEYTVSPPTATGRLEAGACRVDITPPPGFPMGGASLAGRFGRGYWTRLSARAFFLRDASGQSAALVSCDLAAMPGGLPAQVGWLLRGDGLNLCPENIVLAATHVHHGPGNFFSYKLYNDRGSPWAGYDEVLFHWLAERIATAIRGAAADSRKAAPGTSARLEWRSGKATGLLRNRAPEPFLLNADREEVLSAGPPSPGSTDVRHRAVDESLSVLEIHRDEEPWGSRHVASLVFLSVHPEAMHHTTALYQSDFTGLAMAKLEKRDRVVAAFFNGADGDISVRWKRQNRNETLAFAGSLLRAIDGLPPGQPLDPGLRLLVARAVVRANPYSGSAGWSTSPGYSPQRPPLPLASTPLYGAASIGGAEDARTSLFDLGWKQGVRREPRDLQGVKVGAFESVLLPGINLTPFIAAACDYPDAFPVLLVSLGGRTPLTLVALPAELTRTAWWRLRRGLEGDFPALGPFVPIGLANEYIGYVTTPEEYGAQGYEGASCVFGPTTNEVLLGVASELAAHLHPPVASRRDVLARNFYPDWATEKFGPEWLGVAYSDPDEGLEPLIADDRNEGDRHWKNVPYRRWPRFEWREPEGELWSAASRRSIRIVRKGGETLEDESDGNLLTVHQNPPEEGVAAERLLRPAHPRYVLRGPRRAPIRQSGHAKGRRWMAIWIWPATLPPPRDEELRFLVELEGVGTFLSDPFTIDGIEQGAPPTVGPPPPP